MELDERKPRRIKKARVEKHDADFRSGTPLKKEKNRSERRKARQDPECDPGYGRYGGWET